MPNFLISQRVNVDRHGEAIDALEQGYTDFFNVLGVNVYPTSNFVKDLEFYLKGIQYDGLILSGGGDVKPESIDINDNYKLDYSPEREKVESELINIMVSKGLPVLGICRGMHQLNCHFGGKLSLDIHHNEKELRKPKMNHSINIENDFLGLIGEHSVNHYHNHGIRKAQVADCFDIFAVDSDYDVVEGVIHSYLPIMGLQWHPERDSPDNELNIRLLKQFFT